MITILFISGDPRVADLIARFQPKLKARIRLFPDFDQGLKEVFDNRPTAVFIQGDISGISGETVARHIKTLLRGEAPRIVLMHSAPMMVQESKKWFDYAIDFSVPQNEIDEQFKLRLMEIAPEDWQEKVSGPTGSPDNVAVANGVGDAIPEGTHPVESEPFEWESAGSFEPISAEPLSPGATPFYAGGGDAVPLADVQTVLVGRGVEADAPDISSQAPQFGEVMASIIEESVTTQAEVSEQFSSPSVPPSPIVPPRKATPDPVFSPSDTPPPPCAVGAAEQPAASLSSFVADVTEGGGRVRDSALPFSEKRGGAAGKRLTLWAAAIVLLVIGGVVAGTLLFKGEDTTGRPSSKPAVSKSKPSRPLSAPIRADKAVPVAGLPSFIPVSGKDREFGKTHPGWERYRGHGVEYRIFRENGRLKALQVLALNGKAIPESHVATIVKKLTGSELHTVVSQSKKGAYRREVLKVTGKGEVVLYRKGSSIRGGIITLE